MISKLQIGLKSLLGQGLSDSEFYGDLVYKLKKIVGSNIFSAQVIKIISHYKKIGYNWSDLIDDHADLSIFLIILYYLLLIAHVSVKAILMRS